MAKRRLPEDDFVGGFEVIGGSSPAEANPPTVQETAKKKPALNAYEKKMRAKIIAELARRQTEALKLYEPLPHQVAVHQCNSQERLAFGSNQSGKTTCAAVELAYIVTNQHPYLNFPKSGDAFVVGRDHAHLAHTILPKLLKPIDSLRKIRDAETGKWRQYRPREDQDRFKESQPMGPLIPERMIKNIAWENRGQGIPSCIEMYNGWKITFFTANGKPPQGAVVDYVWLDEEVGDEWYDEVSPRLMAKKGRLLWSATPQVGGNTLLMLHERCQAQLSLPEDERSSSEFFMLLSGNVHIDEDEKHKLAEKYKYDADAYRVRIQGQFLILGGLIYPQWSHTKHVIEPFEIPDNWCRYMTVDPGHTVCGVLFFAVPPPDDPKHGGHVYCIDELYIRECDPTKFAEQVRYKTQGNNWQAFIIDDCGSRRTDGAIGISMRQGYSDALKARDIRSKETGSNFLIGSSDVKAGLMQVREWIGAILHHPGYDDRPKLQVFNTCSNLMFEIKLYYKKRHPKGGWTDEPNQTRNHLCDTLRYAAMHGLRYVKPENGKKSLWRKWFDSERKNRSDGSDINLCAGSGKFK